MNLEQQVVSLDLAKKLKELGVKQESWFGWRPLVRGHYTGETHSLSTMVLKVKDEPDWYSAFTVAELGELLPWTLDANYGRLSLQFKSWQLPGEWGVEYKSYSNHKFDICVRNEKTEADARAKMLIYLLEHNLLTKGGENTNESD